jgi:Putative Actinobacterial Holin-X, holin superfamily III
MAEPQGESIQRLIGDALRDSTDLARKELALFKAEMTEKVTGLVTGLAMFVGAAVFAIIALSLFVQSLVEWLAGVIDSEALAALIVGVVMAAAAVGLVLYGKSKLAAFGLVPERTIRNVQRDTQVLTERVST